LTYRNNHFSGKAPIRRKHNTRKHEDAIGVGPTHPRQSGHRLLILLLLLLLLFHRCVYRINTCDGHVKYNYLLLLLLLLLSLLLLLLLFTLLNDLSQLHRVQRQMGQRL
jgi:hypothetical protein